MVYFLCIVNRLQFTLLLKGCIKEMNNLRDYAGKQMYGRLLSYNRKKGYGYIRSEIGSDAYVSAYGFGKDEKKAVIGAFVKFTVEIRNGKPVAKKVSVVRKFMDDVSRIELPNSMLMPIKHICKVGRGNGFSDVESKGITSAMLKEHGYAVRDLDYVYIETPDGTYKFFREGGPVVCDGQVDVDEFFKSLKTMLHSIDADYMKKIKEEDAAGVSEVQ